MNQQLTYADRELLLQTYDLLKTKWHGDDRKLISAASDWVSSLIPSRGFEHGLVRDITMLSRYLSKYKLDPDLAQIARGGLLYVLHTTKEDISKSEVQGLLGDAFITSCAVHEIRLRLGEQTIYNPPCLTKDEQHQAEDMFLILVDKPILSDNDLIQQSQIIINKLNTLVTCGFFQRMRWNIDFLISIFRNNERNNYHKSYARAALSYLINVEDTINDRLGIIGFLDDNFIAQLAVDLIEPARSPWLAILDQTVGVWPFLNSMLIDDGSLVSPLSEFMIINSGLSCPILRGEQSQFTINVVPFPGPLPFLLGFIAALGLVQESGQRDITEQSFQLGQSVIVDNNATAEFGGIMEINGRRMFGITQYRHQQGHRLSSTHYWPLSELNRLVPADPIHTTHGRLAYDLSHTDINIPALDSLFNTPKMARISTIDKNILVVTPVTRAHELAINLRLFDCSLKDIIPMGHLSDDFIKPWSNAFGQKDPLLIIAPDLDAASAFAETHGDSIASIFLDMSGRNANEFTNLIELQHTNSRIVAISSERVADELLNTNDDSISAWEWTPEDYSSLLWPLNPTDSSGPIARYERWMQAQSSVTPLIKQIDCPLAYEVYDSVRLVNSIIRQRGENQLVALDEISLLAFRINSRLLRLSTSLKGGIPSFTEIDNDIQRIHLISNESQYLSDIERTAVNNMEILFRQFFINLMENNPKASIIRELLSSNPDLAIVCPDTRILNDLEQEYRHGPYLLLGDIDETDGLGLHGAIIPGWFRKERMERILIPPATNPLILILYNIEQQWYSEFVIERQKAKLLRDKRSDRSKIFPGIPGWIERNIGTTEPLIEARTTRLRELDEIDEHILAVMRRNAYLSAQSDGSEGVVAARLVLFEGGTQAFLRDSYKATVVTHLLYETLRNSEGEEVDVKHKTVAELKTNDALLFHRRSDRDVIRLAADEELPDGIRDTAALWRMALINFARQSHLSTERVWRLLKESGCPLLFQTVNGWMDDNDMIAPRQYERDVHIIAKVTGDTRLIANEGSVLEAISTIFGAHQRVSHRIAKQVLQHAVDILKEEHRHTKLIELGSDVVLVRIMDIDKYTTQVRVSIVNKLLEPEQLSE